MGQGFATAEASGPLAKIRVRWKSFQTWFQNLKVAQKLMLISIFFVMPDSLMLYLFITGINANIEFARQEMKGNTYQRPLERLLQLLPEHASLAREAKTEASSKALSDCSAQIERVFANLEDVDSRIGADLQFTDEGLAKRKREHYRVSIVHAEWKKLTQSLTQIDQAAIQERHLHLIDDVRMMITHAGDLSNLILDPDLDSYYLMDATLLALPQTQDRLARVMTHGSEALSHPANAAERQQLAIHAALLKEADLDRIVGSLQTGLNEDANFYEISPSLQARLPSELERYRKLSEAFISETKALAAGTGNITAADYLALGREARQASFNLWNVADEELDVLLEKRIRCYEWRRTRSLLVAAMAGLAAFGFVTFITRSISGPLKEQALDLQAANAALQAVITERMRAETELRRSEQHLAAAQEIARIGSWDWDVATEKMSWSDENYRIHGFAPHELEATYDIALRRVHPNDRKYSDTTFQKAVKEGVSFSFEQRIILPDKTERVLHQRGAAVKNSEGSVIEVFGTAQDITERKVSEEKIAKAHQELMKVSRQAGMADVATGVLHNVGNVLNSVNVSASLISDRLTRSRISHLGNVCKLMQEQNGNLGNFLTTDVKGSKLPPFLYSLAERLETEQGELIREAETLSKNIGHIKDIVAVQQNYAKVSGVVEVGSASSLTEDALEMNFAGLNRHGVEVVREFADMPPVRVDKHKVLQILVNIIGNAKYAVSESTKKSKRIVVQIVRSKSGNVQIAVADNGVGIAKANLSRIFAHGFTTKKDGHGFGLHSAALAATEIGGSLSVKSAGPGRGATFTLELPAAK